MNVNGEFADRAIGLTENTGKKSKNDKMRTESQMSNTIASFYPIPFYGAPS